ncbi:ergothioneine biosynthesis protein EgtB [Nocardioidaceae bacterium]|nr:ergothioneine biosynthesis protein EgtB [Nocardioidaceae bacterium]
MREQLAAAMERARARTDAVTAVEEAELTTQHHDLMSPLVWDLAHIGQQEDLWLLRGGDSRRQGVLSARVEQLYDAFEHPRAGRGRLPLLTPAEARSYLGDVRGRVLDTIDGLAGSDPEDPLAVERAFHVRMVEQHELQHVETMTATHQIRRGGPLLGHGAPLPAGRPLAEDPARDAALVPAGEFELGVDAAAEPGALDNEQPAHRVHVDAFRIARHPVSNADWQRFIDAGGYAEPRWWSARGWEHRTRTDLRAPMYWHADGSRRRFGIVEDVPPAEPVQHISFFEAEAYAAWAGARLPTEVEWEKACAWDPVAGRRRRWPWGDSEPTRALVNLDGAALRPAPVGAYPAGASAYGVEQMMGDVWEWTSSDFHSWPGFRPMLYADYSAPFFGGDYKVLRGGSWAVGQGAVRPSFRNWDHPIRRQIFSGLRLAWDVDGSGAGAAGV